jgi:hypothetical protein
MGLSIPQPESGNWAAFRSMGLPERMLQLAPVDVGEVVYQRGRAAQSRCIGETQRGQALDILAAREPALREAAKVLLAQEMLSGEELAAAIAEPGGEGISRPPGVG